MNENKNKKQIVIHPFLFALYPVVSLLALNLDQLSPRMGLRAALVLLLDTAVLFLIFRWLMKDAKKAGLAVSWILVLIFSYKHLAVALENFSPAENLVLVTLALVGLTSLLLLIGPWFIWRFVNASKDIVTTFLNVVALVIVIFPLGQIFIYLFESPDTAVAFNNVATIGQNQTDDTQLPNIFYIIVDGYGRGDVLEELYGHDNSEFLGALAERGFYVADQSSSNYQQTFLSLASSLNFSYLDEVAASVNEGASRRSPLVTLIQNNQVRQILEQAGYEIVIIDSDWPSMEKIEGTALTAFERTPGQEGEIAGLSKFEKLLWDNTIFSYLTLKELTFAAHRDTVLANFESLNIAASQAGPQFVITHIIAPHPPFVFDESGQYIEPNHDYSIRDGSDYAGDKEGYLPGYEKQLTYINGRLLEAIDQILAESDHPPVIVVQGDHGPGAFLDWYSLAGNSCFKERTSILNAYYFPDQSYNELYESITPVNSFRVILNQFLGTALPLLADKSYFSLWDKPYNFIDVTDQKDSCVLPGS